MQTKMRKTNAGNGNDNSNDADRTRDKQPRNPDCKMHHDTPCFSSPTAYPFVARRIMKDLQHGIL
eukprot:2654937-Amphidinium_carterae.1